VEIQAENDLHGLSTSKLLDANAGRSQGDGKNFPLHHSLASITPQHGTPLSTSVDEDLGGCPNNPKFQLTIQQGKWRIAIIAHPKRVSATKLPNLFSCRTATFGGFGAMRKCAQPPSGFGICEVSCHPGS
jgi:hypothetical protein